MLSNEDKQRIEAEETHRASVRLKAEKEALAAEKRTKATRQRNGCMGVLLVIVLIIGLPSLINGFSTGRENAQTRVAEAADAAVPKVNVTFTSDPEGASVTILNSNKGKTPVTVAVPANQEVSYRIEPAEPYDDYDLYKPYNGKLNPSEDNAVNVWLERTTAEEQTAQKQAAEVQRAETARRACEARQAGSALVIESWSWYTEYGYAIAEGKVTNRSGGTLKNVEAVVEFKTSEGQFITSDSSLLDYTDLLPGQSTPFKVYATSNPAMQRASLTFKYLFGGGVSAINRSDLESCG